MDFSTCFGVRLPVLFGVVLVGVVLFGVFVGDDVVRCDVREVAECVGGGGGVVLCTGGGFVCRCEVVIDTPPDGADSEDSAPPFDSDTPVVAPELEVCELDSAELDTFPSELDEPEDMPPDTVSLLVGPPTPMLLAPLPVIPLVLAPERVAVPVPPSLHPLITTAAVASMAMALSAFRLRILITSSS